MPGTGQTYVIAGAGISGLALALALAKFGATVVVLERQPALQEFGAGLQISPNARHVLNQLGLDAALSGVSFEPAALDVYRQRAMAPLVSLDLGRAVTERFDAPYAVMHRADLANILYKACRRFANVDILFGIRQWDVVSHARGVTVSVDEASGQSRTIRARAFIGADGVHSQTRQGVLDGGAPQFGDRLAWRTLISMDSAAGQIATDRVSVFLGRGFHLVCYPLPHRRQVNLALFQPSRLPESAGQPRLGRVGPRVRTLLAAAGSSWSAWPLYTVRQRAWSKGNIGIIGDAAHAMVPFQAQGAAMGIEDAAVLAPLLVGTGHAEQALADFANIRQSRVSKVAALSVSNGRIFHLGWPASMARDLVMRLQGRQAHLRRLGWIYGHRANLEWPAKRDQADP
ncbi:MAG: FAD-dependent monooxygenase [Devosia sp.]|uniref:FAD-dependent monooxygenase n=1 Tax=Devosia sp. TaxID=1871048 RepID=UPI0024C50685|nr:FAD-dependent monooxygenase [Devosia sp.]UYO00589.1 MAG: FAD-dependent monooxygenase [Devosia sp.]